MGVIKNTIEDLKELKDLMPKIKEFIKKHKWKIIFIGAPILICVIIVILVLVQMQFAISQVSINYSEITLGLGETAELHATVLLSNNKQNNKVVWSSSNPSVISVDQSGKIIALERGTSEITAQASWFGKSMSTVCTVNVKTKPTGYSILLSTNSASTSETVKVYVKTLPEDEVTNIDIYAVAPSGEVFQRKLSDNGYNFHTETGTWTIYAVIENSIGSYTGKEPDEIAYLDVSGTAY